MIYLTIKVGMWQRPEIVIIHIHIKVQISKDNDMGRNISRNMQHELSTILSIVMVMHIDVIKITVLSFKRVQNYIRLKNEREK